MNLALLESFGQNYPEEFDGALDCISVAVACSFNREGTLLAVGCNDGRIVIWDFLTQGIAKIITSHVHPVCSLSWSRNGRKLVSASTDNTLSIWDVLSGESEHKYRFPSPILKVQFNPRDASKFLVCLMRHSAVVVTVDTGSHQVIPIGEDEDLNIVASYDRRGTYIYTGNSRGKVSIFTSKDLQLKASFRIGQGTSSAAAVKSIEFARRHSWFLINTADRVIRVYSARTVINQGKDGEPEPVQKLQDLVNKTTWKKCCFSGDGEYICAGSARSHSLYIWDRSIGNIVKILHGTKGELLLDVVWHPVRPIICSISSGIVSIWAQTQVENWSAFAPDFKELDENVEYEERESEFDITDQDHSVEGNTNTADDDIEVDVETEEPIAAFCSSDEEDDLSLKDSLKYLPISPEIEDPEDSSWAMDSQPTPPDQKENSPPKKKRAKVHDVELKDAPTDEVHPLLSNRERSSYGGKKGRARGDGRKGKDRGK